MAACAVDDRLNLIATVAVSDSNIDNDSTNCSIRMSPLMPSKMGRLISSVYLWDAEMMTLLGTLLFPCPALTRDLGSLETAISPPRSCHNTNMLYSKGQVIKGAKDAPQFVDHPHSSTDADFASNVEAVSTASIESKAQITTAQSLPPVRPGTGTQRPVLVTALAFCSPYPLLAGASTGGAVALWRVSDCVCIKVRKVVRGRW